MTNYFDGSEVEIGRGAQAVVYKYKNFAYKVYNPDYPKEWISGEYLIQNEIVKTNLPVVHYFKTSEYNIIKIDLIDGMTLADRMRTEGYTNKKYFIIDWINSRLGNPVYDYARTYVIINEFVPEMGKQYLDIICNEGLINRAEFKKALYVIALLRVREVSNESTNKLIEDLDRDVFNFDKY